MLKSLLKLKQSKTLRATVALKRKAPLKRSKKPIKRSRIKKPKKESLRAFKKKLWKKFAKWIKDTKGNICFSTGRGPLYGKQLHAGHMFSAGKYNALRWEPMNVWPQSAYANIYLKGDYPEFHRRFIERFGQEEYDKLWNRRNDVKQWRIDDLREIDKMIDDDYARRAGAKDQV